MLATTWEEAGAQREEELLLLKRKSHCVVISEDVVNKYFTCQVPKKGKIFPVLGNLTHIGKPLFEMCCFHMGIARKGRGCRGLPGWFGALFSPFSF